MLISLQCRQEGWADKLKDQADEGCNIAGRVRVNKVIGNIHLSPGKSFQVSGRSFYELVPYLRDDGNRHDFSHTIHNLAFEGMLSSGCAIDLIKHVVGDDEYDISKARIGRGMRQQLGIGPNPLDNTFARVRKLLASCSAC